MPSLYITEPSARLRKDGGYFVVEVGEEVVQKLSIETCTSLCECFISCIDGMYDSFYSCELDI